MSEGKKVILANRSSVSYLKGGSGWSLLPSGSWHWLAKYSLKILAFPIESIIGDQFSIRVGMPE